MSILPEFKQTSFACKVMSAFSVHKKWLQSGHEAQRSILRVAKKAGLMTGDGRLMWPQWPGQNFSVAPHVVQRSPLIIGKDAKLEINPF
jgi:hypothetical protein